MSSIQITRQQLRSAIEAYETAAEKEYQENKVAFLKAEADSYLKSNRFWRKVTLGLVKELSSEKAFKEAVVFLDSLNGLDSPDFCWTWTWRDNKINKLKSILGPDMILSDNHIVTITDDHAFILKWIE